MSVKTKESDAFSDLNVIHECCVRPTRTQPLFLLVYSNNCGHCIDYLPRYNNSGNKALRLSYDIDTPGQLPPNATGKLVNTVRTVPTVFFSAPGKMWEQVSRALPLEK